MQWNFLYQKDSTCNNCGKRVLVKASPMVGKWDVLSDEHSTPYSVRYSFYLLTSCVGCLDIFNIFLESKAWLFIYIFSL